ncbi:MAG: hypothetical protein ABW252_14285 [Polyangiales bacterium]
MTATFRSCLAGIVVASLVGCADAEPTNATDALEATDVQAQEAAAGDGIDTAGLKCYKLLAHGGDGVSKFKVGAARDSYYNFTFKAPWQGMAYGIVFRPIIDNKKALHHWLLFQTPGTTRPGVASSVGAHPDGALLAGWAPGGETLDMRILANDDVGLELPGASTYTIEFHYNSTDANALDASGVEVCVKSEKPKEVASLSWLGFDQLVVPAQKWVGTCRPAYKAGPINILGVVPHMHKAGTHMKTVINRANGTKEVLHDKPFDFDYQIQYITPAVIQPGDTLTTECTFDKPMAFGTATSQEMCYNFTLAYPKNALGDGMPWGTLAHGAGSCLGQ